MANKKHLAKLKKGVKTWNEWRENNPDEKPDLVGANLKGKKLIGANFSKAKLNKADIRSTDFTNANLTNADLTNALAGLSIGSALRILIFSILISGILGFLMPAAFGIPLTLDPRQAAFSYFYSILMVLTVLFVFIWARHRSKVKEAGLGAAAAATLGIFMVAFALFMVGEIWILATIIPIVAMLTALTRREKWSQKNNKEFNLVWKVIFWGILAVLISYWIAVFAGVESDLTQAAALLTGGLVGQNLYIAFCASAEDIDNYFASYFSGTLGTRFSGANLTDANFSEAILTCTFFKDAILTRTYWHNASRLDCVHPGDSYLKDTKLRELLVTGKGRGKNFDRLDLRDFNLSEYDLENASFIDTYLYEANLTGANLTGAFLVGTKLEQANLTGATLTNACIKNWRVSKDTVIDNIKCSCIYEEYLNGNKTNKTTFKPEEFLLFIKSKVGALKDIDLSNKNLSGFDLRGADLSDAKLINTDLSGANLRRADLRGAELNGANLSQAKLNRADLFKAYLIGADLRGAELIGVNLEGANLNGAKSNKANLSGAFLRFAKLKGANLTGALLHEATISNADLTGANLTNAQLIRTQAQKADFTRADLTGACIEDWNINSETILNDVICDYIYLKENKQKRRPSDSSRHFKTKEFEKLVLKSLNTVDLVFQDGIDWQVFFETFQKLRVESETGELPFVQTIDNKGDGAFVIRVKIPKNVDEGEYERKFWQKYKPLLDEKDKRIKDLSENIKDTRKANTKLIGIIETMAEKENSKYNLQNAKIYGFAPETQGSNLVSGETVKDNQIVGTQHNYAPEQKQTLTEVAAEIQKLLKQLEESNPTATVQEQQAFVDAAVPPTLKSRFASAIKAGWKELIKELFDNSYLNMGIAILEGWQDAE